jgi:hypothetical protein
VSRGDVWFTHADERLIEEDRKAGPLGDDVELQVLREEVRHLARDLAAEVMAPRGWGPRCSHGILRKCCPPCRGDA